MVYLSLGFAISFFLGDGIMAFFEQKQSGDEHSDNRGDNVSDRMRDDASPSLFFSHKDKGNGDHRHKHRREE